VNFGELYFDPYLVRLIPATHPNVRSSIADGVLANETSIEENKRIYRAQEEQKVIVIQSRITRPRQGGLIRCRFSILKFGNIFHK